MLIRLGVVDHKFLISSRKHPIEIYRPGDACILPALHWVLVSYGLGFDGEFPAVRALQHFIHQVILSMPHAPMSLVSKPLVSMSQAADSHDWKSRASKLHASKCRASNCAVPILIALALITMPALAMAERFGVGDSDRAVGHGKAVGQLEDVLAGYSLVRGHFERGRLVLRSGDDFVVLRQGDVLPGAPGALEVEIEVLEISADRAVLRGRGSHLREAADSASKSSDTSEAGTVPVLVPSQLILIEPTETGSFTITVGSPNAPIDLVVEESEGGQAATFTLDAETGEVSLDWAEGAAPTAEVEGVATVDGGDL